MNLHTIFSSPFKVTLSFTQGVGVAWQRIALRAWTQQPKVRISALPRGNGQHAYICDPVIVYLVFKGGSDSVVLMGKG